MRASRLGATRGSDNPRCIILTAPGGSLESGLQTALLPRTERIELPELPIDDGLLAGGR